MIVASNMQDAVLVDLAAKALPGVEVLFLETGYHFAETIGTRDAVEARLRREDRQRAGPAVGRGAGHRVRQGPLRPRPQPLLRHAQGRAAHDTLAGYDAWVTGVRRVEAPTRAGTPLVTYDEKFGLVKLNPLAAWSDEDMEAYIAEHGMLVNPLVADGLPVDRLRAVHGQAAAGRRSALRALGGHREDRVRAAHVQ